MFDNLFGYYKWYRSLGCSAEYAYELAKDELGLRNYLYSITSLIS